MSSMTSMIEPPRRVAAASAAGKVGSALLRDSLRIGVETKIQDLVLFRNQSENSMTQLARATEVADCMYSRCLRTFSCEIVRTVSQL